MPKQFLNVTFHDQNFRQMTGQRNNTDRKQQDLIKNAGI